MKADSLQRVKTYSKYGVLGIIVAAVFCYAMFQGGFVSWFLFNSVMTVIGLTIAVSFFTFRGFKIERIFNKEVLRAGETLHVQLILKKNALHPFFYVRVRDIAPPGLGKVEEHGALFFFTFQRRLSFSYQIQNVSRGEHVFSDVELVFGDLFGLYEKRKVMKYEGSILVYPQYRKIDKMGGGKSAKVIEGGNVSHQILDEERSLAGVRSYVAGDRLTSIDWKQSARKAQLMTKEFESLRGRNVIVAFDSFQARTSSLHFEKTVELAVSIIASQIQFQSALKVAVWSNSWMKLEVNEQTITNLLKMFAKMTQTEVTAPSAHPMYQDWQGATVYYVCSELHEGLLESLKVIRQYQVNVRVILVAKSNHDKPIIEQIEKLGIGIQTIPA